VNVANRLTVGRFVFTLMFFLALTFGGRLWFDIGLVALLLAGVTDILDGMAARRMNQTTLFGQLADPVVDKVLICGAYVFFAAGFSEVAGGGWAISPWAPLLLIGRELIVSGLRSYAEARGTPIGSTVFGKSKFVVQFISVWIVVLVLGHFGESELALAAAKGAIWVAVFVTLATGAVYLVRVESLLRRGGVV